jgi:hypothetical protein
MYRIAALVLVLIVTPAFGQEAKSERTLTGVWELKSVEIEGKAAPEKALTGMLKDWGGIEIGMHYKFRRPKGDDDVCVLNDLEAGYEYKADIKELLIIKWEGEGKPPKKLRFLVDFAGKNIKLRFKDKQKTVRMTFSPDE